MMIHNIFYQGTSLEIQMLTSSDKNLLVSLYQKTPEALDKLPYTTSFEAMYLDFCQQSNADFGRSEIWLTLTNLRKSGSLPKKGKA